MHIGTLVQIGIRYRMRGQQVFFQGKNIYLFNNGTIVVIAAIKKRHAYVRTYD